MRKVRYLLNSPRLQERRWAFSMVVGLNMACSYDWWYPHIGHGRARDESPRALIAGRLDGSTESATAQTKGNFKTYILASPLILLPLLGRFLFTVAVGKSFRVIYVFLFNQIVKLVSCSELARVWVFAGNIRQRSMNKG